MSRYYFLGAALPELQIGMPPEISFQEFETLLHENLSTKDQRLGNVIRRLYDIENIRTFWKGEELDSLGTMDEKELEEALLAREGFPNYVFDFFDKYDSVEERLKHFPALLSLFFKEEIQQTKGFLKEYLTFERGWRLVFAAFRAKKLGRNVTVEMQYEDGEDDLVAQILAQRDAKTFEPPTEFEELKGIFEEHTSPDDLYQALCQYRFDYISRLLGIDVFSEEKIFGYMAQLILVSQWFELDRKKGKVV